MKHAVWQTVLLGVLALIVPVLVGYDVYYQWRVPLVDMPLDWESGKILDVWPDTYGDYAGFLASDVILSVDGIPFESWEPQVGNYPAVVLRNGDSILMELVVIPMALFNRSALSIAVIVALTFWGVSLILLLRDRGQQSLWLIFALGQVVAVTLLFPIAHPGGFLVPPGAVALSVMGLMFTPSLLLQHAATFPVIVGTSRLRRWCFGICYALSLAAGLAWLSGIRWGRRFGLLYAILALFVALGVMMYVYLRRAGPQAQRRIRLVVFSTLLAGIPLILFYLVPSVMGYPAQIPLWLVGLLIVQLPFVYLYATVRHNLFGIDHLLNRALVYFILSVGILLLYLGPFLLIYSYLGGDLLAQMMIAAMLTLIVGLSFEWSHTRVQRWVDRIFYGGWYDYPGVVEEASNALARCVEREQIREVLTRQIPGKMRLTDCSLWIGEPDAIYPGTPPDKERFRFKFRSDMPAQWTVGPHQDGDDLSYNDRRILGTLAVQAEIALNNVLLIEALRRQVDEIRASREALERTQRQLLRSREDERARLARDLHDSPIQTLAGLNMQLGLLLAQLSGEHAPGDETPIENTLREMRVEVRSLLSELRQVCTELRPPMLDTFGLGAALHTLAETWADQHGIMVHFSLSPDADWRTLPAETAVNLYRVAQESLANIAHHAGVKNVYLDAEYDGTHLQMTIRDEGRGFSPPAQMGELTAEGHFGLAGMQERIALIGGLFEMQSSPGAGTSVRVLWEHPKNQHTAAHKPIRTSTAGEKQSR